MPFVNAKAGRLPRQVLAAALVAFASLAIADPATAQNATPQLFRVVGSNSEVTIGLTDAEFAAMGRGPGVDRLARKLVADGQLTAWQYVVGRGPDGATRYVTTRRIALLRNDTMRIEPYTTALPVNAPSTQ